MIRQLYAEFQVGYIYIYYWQITIFSHTCSITLPRRNTTFAFSLVSQKTEGPYFVFLVGAWVAVTTYHLLSCGVLAYLLLKAKKWYKLDTYLTFERDIHKTVTALHWTISPWPLFSSVPGCAYYYIVGIYRFYFFIIHFELHNFWFLIKYDDLY